MRESQGSLLRLARADAIATRATPWLVEGWLVQESLAGLVAPSGVGKSFLGVDWACCVATGTPWKGHAVKRGPVCYLAGEGQHGLRKRIMAWERGSGVSIEGAPLFVSAGLPFLCEEPIAAGSVDEMNAITESEGPVLVVVDTVARAMGGANENSAEDMSRFVRSMDWFRAECGATVLTIHHTGNDPGAQGRARGSSAYRAALDSEYLLQAVGAREVQLVTSKAKDWAPEGPLRLRKSVIDIPIDGEIESSLYLEQSESQILDHALKRAVLDLHAAGKSERQIEAELGCPKSSVHRWIVAARDAPPRGVLHTPAVGAGCPAGQLAAGQHGAVGQAGR